tara:strand:- start:69369 stop:71030 length:1662 start_codon:yes stop_codon:yes gene_type:complete
MFKPNPLGYSDGYKPGHKRMLAPGTDYLYGTWIPRSFKHAPPEIKKLVSIGQQFTWKWLHDVFDEWFFQKAWVDVQEFGEDLSKYLGQKYDQTHFKELHDLGYLPIKVKALPEGIETGPNIPHMTFINTVAGFAWLTLYLETPISAASWKMPTSATLALQYKRNAKRQLEKTDPDNIGKLDYLCHDFSARGTDPFTMLSSGLGHASSFRGSDTLICIEGARYYYNEPKGEVCINSVNASEHSVSTTKIFTVGEKQMLIDWLLEFPAGILSVVADTFDLWKLLLEYLQDPYIKELIMARNGTLVLRPDSGDPVDIICGTIGNILEVKSVTTDHLLDSDFEDFDYFKCNGTLYKVDHVAVEERYEEYGTEQTTLWEAGYETFYSEVLDLNSPQQKGAMEILWDGFGGYTNDQGYKVLDYHIGLIYGDAINLDRQIDIYQRLEEKKFASSNIILGVGSFTYQFNTRDTLGWAAKGAWFECNGEGFNIYKDPITDDGTKKSLKGRVAVFIEDGEYVVKTECTAEQEDTGELRTIYENGEFLNQISLTDIRASINKLI